MQKIMFMDKYGLTEAVLKGRKTMTRRIAEKNLVENMDGELCWDGEFKKPRYKPGEVVAVAQAYKDALDPLDWVNNLIYKNEPGWTNKMFVGADLMPHRIFINAVRVERLQDISDEDCRKEGIMQSFDAYYYKGFTQHFNSAREAFAALIDKVSGKGTWASNPWVFVYEFELVK